MAIKALTFQPSGPISEPITKFGGQPVWIDEPAWPLSRSTGFPMRFICQIALPPEMQTAGKRMAYVFMTDQGDIDNTWEAEGGENAVILQPGPFTPLLATVLRRTGPTLQRGMDDKAARVRRFTDVELAVSFVDADPGGAIAENNLSQFLGEPRWLQSDEWPAGGPWRFLLQIDSQGGAYDVNFGDAGVGYVFISTDGMAGQFFWQCC